MLWIFGNQDEFVKTYASLEQHFAHDDSAKMCDNYCRGDET